MSISYYFRRLRAKTFPSQSKQSRVHRYQLLGQSLEIVDFASSDAADIVYKELKQDCYGLSQIPFEAGDIVLDIGGHVGFFSILLGRLHPEIQIYAFEPVKENYQHFLENIKRNQVHNIKLHNMAVTQDGRKIQMFMHPKNSGGGLIEGLTQNQNFNAHHHYQVESMAFDEIFNEYSIEQCRLLKIDCEGSEHEILHSSQKLQHIEYLAGEFHSNAHLRAQGLTLEHLLQRLYQDIPKDKIFYSPCEMAA